MFRLFCRGGEDFFNNRYDKCQVFPDVIRINDNLINWAPNERFPLPFVKILYLIIYTICLMYNLLLIMLNDISLDKQKVNF